MDGPNLSAGILGPAPMSSIQSAAGLPSSWGERPNTALTLTMLLQSPDFLCVLGGGGATGVSGNNQSGQNKVSV